MHRSKERRRRYYTLHHRRYSSSGTQRDLIFPREWTKKKSVLITLSVYIQLYTLPPQYYRWCWCTGTRCAKYMKFSSHESTICAFGSPPPTLGDDNDDRVLPGTLKELCCRDTLRNNHNWPTFGLEFTSLGLIIIADQSSCSLLCVRLWTAARSFFRAIGIASVYAFERRPELKYISVGEYLLIRSQFAGAR